VAALPGRAVVVPMDGFHLANAELARLGCADRKGAPHTFDAAGYVALLVRLRRADRKGAPHTFDAAGYVALLVRLRRRAAGEVVYAPAFRREIEEAVAGAIAVPPEVTLVITEGNYLLLDEGHWAGVQEQLDAVWFIDIDDDVRRARLVARHVRYGRTKAEALAWVMRSDEPNAALVSASRERADLILAANSA